MTFSNLTEENINQAILYIDKNGVPPGYKSKTTDLIVNEKAYPPKYVLAVALQLADGTMVNVKDFHTNNAADFLQEKGFNIVKRVKEPEMSDEEKFKHLLEYFVAHLEYKQNKITTTKGYKIYIAPIKKNFVETGKSSGKDWGLQKQIEQWNSFSNGHRIAISISGRTRIRFAGLTSYLNWENTWLNIRAQWDKTNHSIIGLYLTNTPTPNPNQVGEIVSLKDLCLYDDKAPNEKLKKFFKAFEKLIGEKNMGEKVKEVLSLLLNNHNIILHGAPGTGKTYLAMDVAAELVFGKRQDKLNNEEKLSLKEQTGFVQFHQSYDYTDFVEGLRPVIGANDKTDGFECKDGIFKEFCKSALKASKTGVVDNYDECFQKIVTTLETENVISIPLISGKGDFFIALNSDGDGFVTMLKDKKSDEFIKDSTRFFNYNQCYNVYRGLPGTPKKGFDNYRKAIVKYMKDNLGLKDYQAGKNIESSQSKKFVFIIDEINRGEMSKIFGELFFSIDPGYRGEAGRIKTQYQNLVKKGDEFEKGFFVPENVYIIGTMNDIDRSVESMDFAMRRRFAFKEIKADDRIEMLDSLKCGKKNEAVKCMRALNNEIEKISGLSSAYHIGPAYFLKLDNYEGNFEDLWKYHIEGVLREYLRGMPKATDLLTKLKDEYDKSIASGLSASSDDASGSAENP